MKKVTTIPIFIINLKKDVEKKEHMQELCAQYNLQVEFIDTVYGKDLNQKEIASVYSALESNKNIGRELAKAEIGCALSHKNIYEKVVKEQIPFAIIFEDDITFDNLFIQFLMTSKANLSNFSWDCILLNYYIDNPLNNHYCVRYDERLSLENNYILVRFANQMHSTAAYIISFSGAVKMLHELKRGINKPIDLYTGNSSVLNLYGLMPKVIEIDRKFLVQSNIQQERDQLNASMPVTHSRSHSIKVFLKKLRILNLIKRINLLKLKIVDQHLDCLLKKLKYLFEKTGL